MKRKTAVETLKKAEKAIREKERAKVADNSLLSVPPASVFGTTLVGCSASQSPGPMGIASQSPSPTARECSASQSPLAGLTGRSTSQSPLAGLTSKYFLTYVPLTI